MTTTPEGTVRVAREGGRGWHFIDRAKYDANPGAFVVVGPDGKPDPLDHDLDGKKGGAAKSKAEVLAMADGNFMAFKAAARKLLGDGAPTDKAGLLAALNALPE